VLHGLTLDTAFFTGNYAPRFSLQAAHLTPEGKFTLLLFLYSKYQVMLLCHRKKLLFHVRNS